MKHCYTVVSYSDAKKTELECAFCHQLQRDDHDNPRCDYSQKVDVRSDIRTVNHLVENGWSLHTVLPKDQGLAYIVVNEK